MILVTLGTQDKDFSRLLKAIDKEIEKGSIKDKVIVQAGYTKYKSKNMEIFDLIDSKEFDKLVKDCDLLITHGGVGSILTGIKNNKKVIAASRLKKYGEHTNDHQKQIVGEFAKEGYILELSNFSELGKLINEAKIFKPTKYKSNNKKFVSLIENYIKDDNHISWFNKYRRLTSYGYRGIILSLINILVFYILISKFNTYVNVVISFFITLIIELIFNILLNIKISKQIIKYSCIKVISLLLDLVIIHIFTLILNYDTICAKFISNFIVIIISSIIIITCFRKEDV